MNSLAFSCLTAMRDDSHECLWSLPSRGLPWHFFSSKRRVKAWVCIPPPNGKENVGLTSRLIFGIKMGIFGSCPVASSLHARKNPEHSDNRCEFSPCLLKKLEKVRWQNILTSHIFLQPLQLTIVGRLLVEPDSCTAGFALWQVLLSLDVSIFSK